MSGRHLLSHAAILLARRVGGPERDDWVRAMASEWHALDSGKTRWALGCLAAALRDRALREWRLALAVAAAGPATVLANAFAMDAAAPVLRAAEGGTALWMAVHLLNPAIVPLVLGALHPRRAAAIGFLSGLFFVLTPMLGMLVIAGMSPLAWTSLVYAKLGPAVLLYPLAVAAWTGAARLGAWLRQRFRPA